MSIHLADTNRLDESLQSLTYMECKRALSSLVQSEFTHLDDLCFKTENIPPELFINYDKWIEPLAKEIKRMQMIGGNKGNQILIRSLTAETEHI